MIVAQELAAVKQDDEQTQKTKERSEGPLKPWFVALRITGGYLVGYVRRYPHLVAN
jgi:hypothetical protein